MSTEKERKMNVCCECGDKFRIYFHDESGKAWCFAKRSKCLNCQPLKKPVPQENKTLVSENYPIGGVALCMEKSNLTKNQINGIVSALGLKLNAEAKTKMWSKSHLKPEKDHKVCSKTFLNINDPIKAYVLGLIWTDGHVAKKTNAIQFVTTAPDDQYFAQAFLQTGEWSVSRGKYGNGWKDRVSIYTTNRFIHEFLKENDFCNKELGFGKIYDSIPEEYKLYFLIGIVDGDGCFYAGKKKSSFSIASSHDQDWSCLENIFRKLEINWTIERTQSKSGNYSKIHINGKSRVAKFGDFIYKNYQDDQLGLPRKYEKYLLIKEKSKKKIYKSTLIFQPQ